MKASLLHQLSKSIEGTVKQDKLSKTLYATDASVYRKMPIGVAFPKTKSDIQKIVSFAYTHQIGIIPRTAGTSLAGQCVGEGLVVDVSKHFTKILELDIAKKQVRVEPGVIRDELNTFLAPHGLFFGPNTSTGNRCMIGGMVGNNSSGTTSIQYGVTREKIAAIEAVLWDGSLVVFNPLNKSDFQEKMKKASAEGQLYKGLYELLSPKDVQKEIIDAFPKKEIHRRNTGYAIDLLLESEALGGDSEFFKMSDLLSGSEGTLAFTTQVTLQLNELPPSFTAMVVTHYNSLQDCLQDVVPVMKHNLYTCEMMDKIILDCTKLNRAQAENRKFIEGDPAAVLMLEVRATSEEKLSHALQDLIKGIQESGLSYANPVLKDSDIGRAGALRKAGLGLLGNIVGDQKAVACIEDTAVALEDLKDFIEDFTKIMKTYDQDAVYYAHAGAGEIHLRPILNLKKSTDVELFRAITLEVAMLTKKYKGSFSGEHGDGIVRAEFIPLLIGDKNYQLLESVKHLFDPKGIFNPGKIVKAYAMDESLRYDIDRKEPEIKTLFNFSDKEGILKAAEACNGSGDCRKTHDSAGGMCPSYHVTKNEKDTTRGRANALREFLTHPEKRNAFDSESLKEVFDLCLSCKACSSECPSNVDITSFKSEFLHQYQEENGYSLRAKLFAYNTAINALTSKLAPLSNLIFKTPLISHVIKALSGVSAKRSIPSVHHFNFDNYLKTQKKQYQISRETIVLFIDEFTRYMDIQLGKDAIRLLSALGYEVLLWKGESGRTFLSKGFLKQAQSLAVSNLNELKPFLKKGYPILGLEPSAILSFRDEYKRLLTDEPAVNQLSESSFLVEEYLAAAFANGKLTGAAFTKEAKIIKTHVHCHQKSLSNQKVSFDVLNLPENYKVTLIPSGCCGMAGSFGYEKEHYDLSMQVGNLTLFPAVRKAPKDVIIAANGTSCRHQIKDGTGRNALHPVSILSEALL
ncbi:MAG: FAD-linked oxidase C-terminal domain-containing protein [Flavobacteriaceae bacterium]